MTQPTLTPAEFARRWRGVTAAEKAAAQSHLIDLCRMFGEPTLLKADPTGEHYAFECEKRVNVPTNVEQVVVRAHFGPDCAIEADVFGRSSASDRSTTSTP